MFSKEKTQSRLPSLSTLIFIGMLLLYAAGFRVANLRRMQADQIPWSPIIHGEYEQ